MGFYDGVDIFVVEDGRTFTDPKTGETHTVTKGSMVRHGLFRIYVVQSDYDAIKARLSGSKEGRDATDR